MGVPAVRIRPHIMNLLRLAVLALIVGVCCCTPPVAGHRKVKCGDMLGDDGQWPKGWGPDPDGYCHKCADKYGDKGTDCKIIQHGGSWQCIQCLSCASGFAVDRVTDGALFGQCKKCSNNPGCEAGVDLVYNPSDGKCKCDSTN